MAWDEPNILPRHCLQFIWLLAPVVRRERQEWDLKLVL